MGRRGTGPGMGRHCTGPGLGAAPALGTARYGTATGSILHRARYGTGAGIDGTPGSVRDSPGGLLGLGMARYGTVTVPAPGTGLGTARYGTAR